MGVERRVRVIRGVCTLDGELVCSPMAAEMVVGKAGPSRRGTAVRVIEDLCALVAEVHNFC